MMQETPPIPIWKDDARKQDDLRRMKFRATTLLVGVTLVFIAATLTRSASLWVGFVQATAEAAMVGAIADWFAVTALFRHPLGLKIPHTAIIPVRKNNLGERLGQFIQENFLTGDIIVEKIRSMHLAHRIAVWLSRPENSANISKLANAGFSGIMQVVRDEDVQEMIERGIVARIKSVQVAPVVGNILNLVTSGPRQRELAYGIVRLLVHVVKENKATIRKKIIEETPWWLPGSIDRRLYERILTNLEKLQEDIENDQDHPVHERFNEIIERVVDDLKYSPEVIAKGEAIKEDILQHPVVREFSSTVWRDIKTSLDIRREREETGFSEPVQRGIMQIGQTLMHDEALLAKVDRWIEEVAYYVMREYGHEIGPLIAHTVRKWDADATSRKIELQVGTDLQFIRINGTIVGGMVGFVIHVISLILK